MAEELPRVELRFYPVEPKTALVMSKSSLQYWKIYEGWEGEVEWANGVKKIKVTKVVEKDIGELNESDATACGFSSIEEMKGYVLKLSKGSYCYIVYFGYLEEAGGNVVGDYIDWAGIIPVLENAYASKEPVLIIGPAGTGKTHAVRVFAEKIGKTIDTVNFSLRTREVHLVGTKTLENGTVKFQEGVLIRSMKTGSILYLDELNCAAPEVLVRLDEALDDRRQVSLKEADKFEVVKASPDWWVVATINPLGYAGTQELPHQILSRFPVRIWLGYPPPDIETKIVEKHVEGLTDEQKQIVFKICSELVRKLREMAMSGILPYSPTVRETIAFARLLKSGMAPEKAAVMVFANCYAVWGGSERQKVIDLITSIGGA